MTPPRALFADADNTLWDTDRVFADAQLDLLRAIEVLTGTEFTGDRLAYVRAIDQGIAGRHHAGLRYPPRLLVHALASALGGEEQGRAVRIALSAISGSISGEQANQLEEAFFASLAQIPEPRPGVKTALRTMSEAGVSILIVTEGARAKIDSVARALGLDRFITRIIEGAKRPDLYRRVIRLTRTPQRAFMIGDQLDRDIAPAKAAGLETIFFPGGFRPHWSPEVAKVAPDHVVASFADVPAIVLDQKGRK